MLFRDRVDAGKRLGARLQEFVRQELPPKELPGEPLKEPSKEPLLVLGLPRGGVPVAFEVANALRAPLEVFVVRKLGAPGHRELAMGAIASGGVRVINQEAVRALGISPAQMEEATARELRELERRERAYRGDRAPVDASGRAAILVDDGLATGYTMRAAVAALRQMHPKRIIVAVPVAARSTCEELAREADAVVCLFTPLEFVAVGQWYGNFSQTGDDEVRALLERAAKGERRHAA